MSAGWHVGKLDNHLVFLGCLQAAAAG